MTLVGSGHARGDQRQLGRFAADVHEERGNGSHVRFGLQLVTHFVDSYDAEIRSKLSGPRTTQPGFRR